MVKEEYPMDSSKDHVSRGIHTTDPSQDQVSCVLASKDQVREMDRERSHIFADILTRRVLAQRARRKRELEVSQSVKRCKNSLSKDAEDVNNQNINTCNNSLSKVMLAQRARRERERKEFQTKNLDLSNFGAREENNKRKAVKNVIDHEGTKHCHPNSPNIAARNFITPVPETPSHSHHHQDKGQPVKFHFMTTHQKPLVLGQSSTASAGHIDMNSFMRTYDTPSLMNHVNIMLGNRKIHPDQVASKSKGQMGLEPTSLSPFELAEEETLPELRPEQESFFIGLMKEIISARGNCIALDEFSENEWLEIRMKYYMRWKVKYNLKAFQNKYTTLKERFREFKKLVEESSGPRWHPVLVTLDASDSWWDAYLKMNPKMKNVRRFQSEGCPEYKDLEVIFRDIIATEHLQAIVDSAIGDNGQNEATNGSPAPQHSEYSVDNNDQDPSNQSGSQNDSVERARNDRGEPKMLEPVAKLGEASSRRAESRSACTLTRCMDIIEAMDINVGRRTYAKVINLLQNSGWRKAFLHMSDSRRKDILFSLQEGDL